MVTADDGVLHYLHVLVPCPLARLRRVAIVVQTDAVAPEVLYPAFLHREAVDTFRLYGVRPLQEGAAVVHRTEGDVLQFHVSHAVGNIVGLGKDAHDAQTLPGQEYRPALTRQRHVVTTDADVEVLTLVRLHQPVGALGEKDVPTHSYHLVDLRCIISLAVHHAEPRSVKLLVPDAAHDVRAPQVDTAAQLGITEHHRASQSSPVEPQLAAAWHVQRVTERMGIANHIFSPTLLKQLLNATLCCIIIRWQRPCRQAHHKSQHGSHYSVFLHTFTPSIIHPPPSGLR